MMVFTIAGRELRSMFLSPLAWAVLAVVQVILAFLFLSQIDLFLQLQPRLAGLENAPGVTQMIVMPLYANAIIVLLMVVPLMTMRLISEERRSRTLSLLLSAPVSMTEIVLGKFVGIMTFLLLMLMMIVLMPLSLLLGGTLDFGVVASGFLGLLLLLASFAAAGLFMSTLTTQPTVAAVSTFGLLLMLWMLDWSANSGGEVSELFAYLSMLHHYQSLLKGAFNSSDVIYYLLFIVTFLGLSIRRLDADRLHY